MILLYPEIGGGYVLSPMLRCAGLFCLTIAAAACSQNFKNPSFLRTNSSPLNVATADVNRDGRPDLLYVDYGTMHVLLGNGNGTFTRGQDVALPTGTGAQNTYLNLGDVSGDGIADVVLGGLSANSNTQTVATLLGNGDGTYKDPVVSSYFVFGATLASGMKYTMGDLNGDGAVDLVVPDSTNGQLYLLLGDKTGNFRYRSSISFAAASEAYLRDVNGDGRLDLVALSSGYRTVAVYFGRGDGTFGIPTSYTSGSGPLVFSDLDGDAIPDLATSTYSTSNGLTSIVMMKGRSDGSFAAPATLVSAANINLLDSGNYAGHGRADLLVSTPAGVGVYPRNADGTYGVMVPTLAGLFNFSCRGALADFNGDGKPDFPLAVFGGIALMLGTGSGSFASGDLYDTGNAVGPSAVVAFSGSKRQDIAVITSATYPRLLLGNGSGSFTLAADRNSTYSSDTPSGSVLTGDFNGDGNSDLYYTPRFNSASLQLGQSDESFSSPASTIAGAKIVADVNKDGRDDLIAMDDSGITVFLAQANGSFTQVKTPSRISTANVLIASGDINGDGVLDVAARNQAGLDFWLGKTDGTFTYSNTLASSSSFVPTTTSFGRTALADVNGDGITDLVFHPVSATGSAYPETYELRILLGDGHGGFAPPIVTALGIFYTSLQLADVDKDGKPDLVLGGQSVLSVMMNRGAGAFGPEIPYLAGSYMRNPVVADLNQDGFPDLVVPTSGGTTVAVLLNQPAPGKPPEPKATLVATPEPSAYGEAFTIALNMAGGQQPAPTGTVSFYVGGAFVATSTISGGSAACRNAGTLRAGSYTVLANYNGDANYSAATFSATHVVLDPVYSTTTTLTATPATAFTSQTVRFQATVTYGQKSATVGLVSFAEGNVTLGVSTLDATGIAFLDTSMLAQGVHNVVAKYLGGTIADYPASTTLQPSTSLPVAVTILAVPTSVSLTSSMGTGIAGTVVNLVATVSASSGAPFGSVTFSDGIRTLGTIAMVGNQATFSTASLARGSHSVVATFNSNAVFAASSSAGLPVQIQSARTTLAATLVTMKAIAQSNGTVQLMASVFPKDVRAGGAVTFLADGVMLGSAAVSQDGIAVLSDLPVATTTHSFTASYQPNGVGYAPGVSPVLAESGTFADPKFSLQVGSDEIAVPPSHPGSVQLDIQALGVSAGDVTLACSDCEEAGYAVAFGTPTVAIGSGTQILISHMPQRLRAFRNAGGPALLCMCCGLALLPTRRRRVSGISLALGVASLMTVAGCGSVADRASSSSVITLHATWGAGSTATIHSAQIVVKPEH